MRRPISPSHKWIDGEDWSAKGVKGVKGVKGRAPFVRIPEVLAARATVGAQAASPSQ